MRRDKGIGIIIVVLFIAFSIIEARQMYNEERKVAESRSETYVVDNDNDDIDVTKDNTDALTEKLEVHYIDVNQGDCTLIKAGDDTMLIDAGNNGYGTLVKRYLEEQGIEQIDYVVGTHPDADHIGGLDVVIYNFDCENIYMPDISKETRSYEDVVDICENKNYKINLPVAGTEYKLGEAEFTIIAPLHYEYGDNYNNYSIAIMLEYGESKFLFTGDCEEEAEMDLINSGTDLDADVFKVAHHGSKTANTREFLEAVSPIYCVISCAEGNSFGHPHAQFINDALDMGLKLFRTDEQGTIVAYSDGKEITFNMSPSETWKVGE